MVMVEMGLSEKIPPSWQEEGNLHQKLQKVRKPGVLKTECHLVSRGKPRRWNCRSTPLPDDPEEKEENLGPHRVPQEAPGG